MCACAWRRSTLLILAKARSYDTRVLGSEFNSKLTMAEAAAVQITRLQDVPLDNQSVELAVSACLQSPEFIISYM